MASLLDARLGNFMNRTLDVLFVCLFLGKGKLYFGFFLMGSYLGCIQIWDFLFVCCLFGVLSFWNLT